MRVWVWHLGVGSDICQRLVEDGVVCRPVDALSELFTELVVVGKGLDRARQPATDLRARVCVCVCVSVKREHTGVCMGG